ncbi:hypothetical protein C9374_003550 [Naegleria lovaniensis]|uniref:Uncharacterized protein n=1 Tax=Naegleria lovaniensis TaxID=51637 RepID=A0AA88KS22_NAELO|nr:uncharacterized protein C9374_003550 [Naegleria lovaniensis]KAG2393786.1 hypothetical protein C9374_003550 [Naegleria lovaniensis]
MTLHTILSTRNKVMPFEETAQTDQLHQEYEKVSQHSELERSRFSISIKCLIIVLLVSAIVVSVLFLTTVWVTSFSSSVSIMSDSLMMEQFTKIINYTDETITKVVVTSQTTKNILWHTFNYSDIVTNDLISYKLFKSAHDYLGDVLVTVYFGDTKGGNIGMFVYNGTPMIIYLNTTGQYFSYCKQTLALEYCITNSQYPDVVLPPFDLGPIMDVAQNYPNQPTYTLSYTDVTLPSVTFMSLINSKPTLNVTRNDGFSYDWYLGIDMSVSSISQYLKKAIDNIPGSFVFTIEVKTDFIIASSFPTLPVSIWDSQGKETRKTALTFDSPLVNDIGRLVYSHFNNQLTALPCGNYTLLNYGVSFINIYRYCNPEGVDWLFVYSVPQWFYLENMIVAVIVALFSSLAIVVGGVALGVWFSMKMIQPIQNLVVLFASVSNMDLDSIDITSSSLSEVFLLQQHFKFMVNKMRQYRCFIPPHLLAQIESSEPTKPKQVKDSTQESSKNLRESNSISGTNTSAASSSNKVQDSQSSGKRVTNSMFKLGLEKRKFTSSAIHFVGLDRALESLSSKEVTMLLHDFFEVVQKTSSQSSSYLGNFEQNTVNISWNLTSDVSNHEEKSIAITSFILEKLQALPQTKWSKYENLQMKFIAATVSQECVCGNIGTNQCKSFSVFGSYQFNLKKLIKHASKLQLSLVTTRNVSERIKHSRLVRFIGHKKLLPNEENIPFVSRKTSEKTEIYEVGESTECDMDEWMYELEQKKRKEKWNQYHSACEKFLSQEYETAKELFQTYFKENQSDLAASYMIHQCSSKGLV